MLGVDIWSVVCSAFLGGEVQDNILCYPASLGLAEIHIISASQK